MPRHVPVSVALLSCLVITSTVAAQSPARALVPVAKQASASGGHIRGTVRDDIGSALGGVMVVALGTTLAAARSDLTGHYALALPPGEYILRATRDGYVSTYREPIRMQTSVELERNITLVRQGTSVNDDHAHDEAAWRLRYLPRTVLRDVGSSNMFTMTGNETAPTPSLFSNAGFTGQLNYLTTSLLPTGSPNAVNEWGIASASVGAPVGSVGDWIVRGAFNAGDVSSWVLHGEYRSRANQTHMLTLGVSHSAQTLIDRSSTLASADQSRSVGDVYGFDRWHAARGLEIDYGARIDRYDYLTVPTLFSPQAGVRYQFAPGMFAVASAAYDRVAPGADEFLPPAAAGPWLPPQRTFSSLAGAPLAPEAIDSYAVGFDQRFGSGDHERTVSVRRFRQFTEDQVVTLFGVDVDGDTSHYYVATPGDVQVDGWSLGIGGEFARHVRGQINYSLAQAAWSRESSALALSRVAPSVVRDGHESVRDLTTALATTFPSTSTEVSFVYRLSTAFSQADSANRLPQLDGRFDVEVHQALPYQPIRGGHLDVLFALRNLFYDARDTRSMFDELLTVKPPLRFVGGIQIRF
jgi:hypothetical protein